MTETQRLKKKKSVKAQRLRLKVSAARTDADQAAAAVRNAKTDYKKARKAYKLAKRSAKESRKTLKALMRKLRKRTPAKISKTNESKTHPAAAAQPAEARSA